MMNLQQVVKSNGSRSWKKEDLKASSFEIAWIWKPITTLKDVGKIN